MIIAHSSTAVRRAAVAALIGGLLLAAAGCGRNSLVGKWQGSVPLRGQTLPVTMEFKPDGTETQTTALGSMSIVANGTYVVKDTSLQTTQTAVTLNGKAMPMPAQASKAQTVPFKVDGDTLTLTPPNVGQSVTLTRVKQ